jgi:hypothetical protein
VPNRCTKGGPTLVHRAVDQPSATGVEELARSLLPYGRASVSARSARDRWATRSGGSRPGSARHVLESTRHVQRSAPDGCAPLTGRTVRGPVVPGGPVPAPATLSSPGADRQRPRGSRSVEEWNTGPTGVRRTQAPPVDPWRGCLRASPTEWRPTGSSSSSS